MAKNGLLIASVMRRREKQRVEELKNAATMAEVSGSGIPMDLSVEVMTSENDTVIYLNVNTRDSDGNEVHPHIATISESAQMVGQDTKDRFSGFGDFLTYEEIKDLANEATFEVVGALSGGLNIVLKATKVKVAKNINIDTSTTSFQKVKDVEKIAISQSGLSQNELDMRIAYLEKHGINVKKTPLLFVMVLLMIHKQDKAIEKPKKLYVNNIKGESLIKRILRNIVLGDPIILEGPKSTGKNVAWESISWVLNRPMEILNCSARMTYATMFGSPQTDNTAKDRITLEGAKSFIKSFFSKKENDEAAEFLKNLAACMAPSVKTIPGPVSRAILSANEKGTMLIADELNLSDPNTFSGAFNGLTDKHTTEYNIGGIGVVTIPRGFIVGGTQNATGGTYVGTKQQNQATMSRFNVIQLHAPASIKSVLLENKHIDFLNDKIGLNQLPEEAENEEIEELQRTSSENDKLDFKKYQEYCKNYGKYVDILDEIYRDFQDLVESGGSTEDCLNVRGFERALSHILLGQSLADSVSECVINTCPEDMRMTLEMTVQNRAMEIA